MVNVGRLGKNVFSAGWYAYVGSALGKGGLAARLKHHLGETQKPHWHIDYLKKRARIVQIWVTEHGRRQECRWAAALRNMAGAAVPAAGFGASDCRCESHLFYFPKPLRLTDFNRCLDKASGTDAVRQILPAV